MKKKELCAVACLFWLAGCSDPASDEIEIVKNLFPVQFSVQLQKEVLPFYSTRSMPPNTVPEPTVPDGDNPDKELKELCSAIEYLQRRRPAGVGKTPDLPCRHRTRLRHCLRHASCRQLPGLPAGSSVAKSYIFRKRFQL